MRDHEMAGSTTNKGASTHGQSEPMAARELAIIRCAATMCGALKESQSLPVEGAATQNSWGTSRAAQQCATPSWCAEAKRAGCTRGSQAVQGPPAARRGRRGTAEKAFVGRRHPSFGVGGRPGHNNGRNTESNAVSPRLPQVRYSKKCVAAGAGALSGARGR